MQKDYGQGSLLMLDIKQWVESKGDRKNKIVLIDRSYFKRFLLTPIQKLTISIQHLALCPNTNYVRTKKDTTVVQIPPPLPSLFSVDTRSLAGLQCLSSPQVKEPEREGFQVAFS